MISNPKLAVDNLIAGGDELECLLRLQYLSCNIKQFRFQWFLELEIVGSQFVENILCTFDNWFEFLIQEHQTRRRWRCGLVNPFPSQVVTSVDNEKRYRNSNIIMSALKHYIFAGYFLFN